MIRMRALIARYRERVIEALFETLIRRYEREIYSYLRRYIGNAEMAEDAFQGTFLQVHLKCHQFDSDRRFRPWLYAIATNQAIDVQRRNKRHRMVSLDRSSSGEKDDRGNSWSEKLVGDSPDPLLAAADGENSQWVNESVESLGRVDAAGDSAGLLPRAEVPRGCRGIGYSRGNRQEPPSCRSPKTWAAVGRVAAKNRTTELRKWSVRWRNG